MTYEQKEGQGSLFKNSDRETEQHPTHRGSLTLGGVQYWISAWPKTMKSGDKFLSLSVQPKKGPAATPAPVRAMPDFDDTIGF